ncbi:MAG: carbohydrate kinase [Acidobacteriota bacterium]
MNSPSRPIVFGEVLFDRFPDGSEVLGGAPFNVAWHLAGFGLDPLLITRIGQDEPGERVLAAMRAHGLDTAGVQRDPAAPTGAVEVRLGEAGPGFEIAPDQAFDRIEGARALAALAGVRPSLLYHGTLAARAPASADALAALRAAVDAPRFVDVNLRAPWWSREDVIELCAGAAVVKLNDDELLALDDGPADAIGARAARFRERVGSDWLIVTRGADGALLLDGRSEPLARRPQGGTRVVDTVGAGDAFSAVAIAGRLGGWPAGRTLERAVAFAAWICEIRGAVPRDRTLYDRALAAWQETA